MENIERYKHLNKYLKNKFGERTLKICIDGGFTCPNRINSTGCIFCSERGSGDHINTTNEYNFTEQISTQVKNYFSTYKAKRANKFIAYFQNFTNTYGPIDVLKAKYDAALIDDRIVALAIATRPDCINEEVCTLLKKYTYKYYVWVELGLQSSNDSTGNLINRRYSSKDFSNAVLECYKSVDGNQGDYNLYHLDTEDIVNKAFASVFREITAPANKSVEEK